MIPTEDSDCVYTADNRFNWRDTAEESEFLEQIQAHNNNISAVIDSFSARMEQWKSEKDSGSGPGTKGKTRS